MQMLALHGHQARRWEPRRLRLRLLPTAGLLATRSRTRTLHLSSRAPWTSLTLLALDRLRAGAAIPGPAG
jgi:hypothetical protein